MRRIALLVPIIVVYVTACSSVPQAVEVRRSATVDSLQIDAHKGDPKSEMALGLLHYMGLHVERDFGEASRWFSLAASHGMTEAIPDLWNTPSLENPASLMWFRLAAAQGNPRAQRELARYYSGAQGLTIGLGQDNVRSYMWYKILSANKDASTDIPLLIDVIGQRLTPSERILGDKMAQDCLSQMEKGCD